MADGQGSLIGFDWEEPMARIESVEGLEAIVGKKAPSLDLKVVDHIDTASQAWLYYSTVMLATLGGPKGPRMVAGGGAAGFAYGSGETLRIPDQNLDDPETIQSGAAFGSLWLVPGMKETLRINGTVSGISSDAVTVHVLECYLHCAKAFLRSNFWQAAPSPTVPSDPIAFARRSSLMALGTIDTNGHADVSPKGDPPDRLIRFDGERLVFADRPGNRRTDSFRNILLQPSVALQALIPGVCEVLSARGEAILTDDMETRQLFEVEGKVPKLAIEVLATEWSITPSPALQNAKLWPAPSPPEALKPAKIFAEHMRLSKQKSLSARMAKAAVTVPGLVRRSLESDYEKNLY
ncbi:MAG: pyridoxamine 5'-phosphate oxidase family protein [Pseudomonadota bacterium]